MKSSIKTLRHQAVHKCNLNMERQFVRSKQIDVQTGGQSDRKLKTEEPKILSNVIFYFKTAIIGDQIIQKKD